MATSKTIDHETGKVMDIIPVEQDGNVFREIAEALNRDREVIEPSTVLLAETTVLMLGASELKRIRDHSLPGPMPNEAMGDYITRLSPMLTPVEIGQMNDMGLVSMLRLGQFSNIGLEARLYASLIDGSWRHSPNHGNDFQAWVRNIIMDQMNKSAATASRYSNGCLMLKWLYDNQGEIGIKLPKRVESCFTGEFSMFSAVTRALPKLNQAAKVVNSQEASDEDHYAALDDIRDLVSDILNPEVDKAKMDEKGRAGASRVEPIAFVVKPGGQLNTYNITAEGITFEQFAKAQINMKGAGKWLLVGQADDELVVVQYKRVAVPMCPVCVDVPLYSLLQDPFPRFGCGVCQNFFEGEPSEYSKYKMAKDGTLPSPTYSDEWYYRGEDTGGEWIMLDGDPREGVGKDEYQVGTAQVDDLYGLATTLYTYRRRVDWLSL